MSIAAHEITLRRNGEPVLAGASIRVDRGEVVAVMGPNGAGKSTLLGVLAGLLAPDEGHVVASGRPMLALQTPHMMRRSVRANVEAGLAWWGVERPLRRERAERALEALGVLALADRRADMLSGGQARRVHLARALAVQATTLMLDEPFAGLDPEARSDLLFESEALLRDRGRATILVVQDLAEAMSLADRVVVIIDGRDVAAGSPQALFAAPPDPTVARLFGYRGTLRSDGRLRMLLPSHVVIDDRGRFAGAVTHVAPLGDGAQVGIEAPGGRVWAQVELPAPAIGSTVRFEVSGGVEFPD